MPNFIDGAKKEIQQEMNSYAKENKFIENYIEGVKRHIKEAIKKNQSEYWFISSRVWAYDSYTNESISSTDPKPKDFWTELEKYKHNDHDWAESLITWPMDYNYINKVLTARLKELGCKDVLLFLGPVKVKRTVVLGTKPGFFGKKTISEEREETIIKSALRITW